MILPFRQPGSIIDPLTEIARAGARRMLMAALKAASLRLCRRVFPKTCLPMGASAWFGMARDRATDLPVGARVRCTSNILPKWARRSKSLDALLPALYLRGLSTGDFQEALSALLGTDAPNLSPGVIARLTAGWQEDHDRGQDRDLSARRYVCIRADRVYRPARMEPEAECILVLIGATPEASAADQRTLWGSVFPPNERPGCPVGIRESAQSWRALLVGIKARGLAIAPQVAVGDGALG